MISIRENIPLSELTTFKIGGSARRFVEVKTQGEIIEGLQWAKSNQQKYVILAGGSNVLIPDAGVSALVIRITGDAHFFEKNTLVAEAGCVLLDLIKETSNKGLGGWENLAGIPGSIGGAIRGNAGAFGTEIKDVVISVDALNAETLELKTFLNADCDFSYRMSFFKKNSDWIVLRSLIAFDSVNSANSEKQIAETISEREKRHLQNVRAAGSFFMNPVVPLEIQKMFSDEKGAEARGGRVPAGWLIEKVGMKGMRVGGAIASQMHPNYLVNTGDATAADVLQLASEIKSAVQKQFGISLFEEAQIIEI